MEELKGLSNEELRARGKKYNEEAKRFRDPADCCYAILISRDAAAILREGEAARRRAKARKGGRQ